MWIPSDWGGNGFHPIGYSGNGYNWNYHVDKIINDFIKAETPRYRKKDKTYSDMDVLRIWLKHLNLRERINVHKFFTLDIISGLTEEIMDLESLIYETWSFINDLWYLIQLLFSLKFIAAYILHKKLKKQRKVLLEKWMDFLGFPEREDKKFLPQVKFNKAWESKKWRSNLEKEVRSLLNSSTKS